MIQQSYFWVYTQKNEKKSLDASTPTLTVVSFTTAKGRRQPRVQQMDTQNVVCAFSGISFRL
jgi:hypothetical protein